MKTALAMLFAALALIVFGAAIATGNLIIGSGFRGGSIREIIHDVEYLKINKASNGGWVIDVKDDGDEVGYMQAIRNDGYTQLIAADALEMGHKFCQALRNGAGSNEVVNLTMSNLDMTNLDTTMLTPKLMRKVIVDLVTNAQMYLCTDTLHNGTAKNKWENRGFLAQTAR